MLGYDFLWAEAEHSTASPESIERLIIAAERRGMPSLVRVGYGYQKVIGHLQKYLTSGATGIILPQCETAEDAQLVVEAVKFPPLGRRGLAGDRWNSWGLHESNNDHNIHNNNLNHSSSSLIRNHNGLSMKERVEEENKTSICGVMIESKRGLNNLEEILQVPHLDFISFGPTDISCDLGYHGQYAHPEVSALIEKAGERILESGLATGTLILNQEEYEYWRARGFTIMCCVAQSMFVNGASNFKQEMDSYEKKRAEK